MEILFDVELENLACYMLTHHCEVGFEMVDLIPHTRDQRFPFFRPVQALGL